MADRDQTTEYSRVDRKSRSEVFCCFEFHGVPAGIVRPAAYSTRVQLESGHSKGSIPPVGWAEMRFVLVGESFHSVIAINSIQPLSGLIGLVEDHGCNWRRFSSIY